jgi:hypothetical protein
MKNKLLALFFVFLFVNCFNSKVVAIANNQPITELTVYDNDSTFRYLYLYDNNGIKVLETKYYAQNKLWIRQSQTEWLYQGDKCVTQLERIWNNYNWIMSYSINYDFENDLLKDETHYKYVNGASNPVLKISYIYDKKILYTKTEYNWQENAWLVSQIIDYKVLPNLKADTITTRIFQSGNVIKTIRFDFDYYADGNLASQMVLTKEGNDWIKNDLINWYYQPGSNNVISQRSKTWSTKLSIWENTQNILYEYNSNNQLITETYQYWKSMFWQNATRYNYEIDSDSKLVKKAVSFQIYNEWRNIISINYSDFVGDKANVMESQYEFWGGNKGELTSSYIPFMFNNEMAIQKGKSIKISYLPQNDSTDSKTDISNRSNVVTVYPNPSNGIYYINTQQYAIQSWTVSDLNGKVLKKHIQTYYSGVIDISDLSRGVYILKVMNNNGQITQKLMKE